MNTNKGTLKSVSGSTLELDHGDGTMDTYDVAPGVSVTLNGKPSSLDKLQPGDVCTLSGDPATSVAATR